MNNLSPATQAIWDAFNDVSERVGVFEDYGDALAAAFRAAADQVMPEENNWPHYMLGTVRRKFLAIADELEGQ